MQFQGMAVNVLTTWLPEQVNAGRIKLVKGHKKLDQIVDHMTFAVKLKCEDAKQVLWTEAMEDVVAARILAHEEKQNKRSLSVFGQSVRSAGTSVRFSLQVKASG